MQVRTGCWLNPFDLKNVKIVCFRSEALCMDQWNESSVVVMAYCIWTLMDAVKVFPLHVGMLTW